MIKILSKESISAFCEATRKTTIAITVFLIISIFLACNGKGSIAPDENTVDSSFVSLDTSTVILDTMRTEKPALPPIKPDRSPASFDTGSSPEPRAYRSGILGYSYFPHMKQHETRSVFAYISINNPASLVVSRVAELNADEIPVRENDTVTIATYNLNMLLFKYVDVNLIQNDSDFIIKEIHPVGRQEVDTLSGNKWQWNITPKTTKPFSKLTLNVVAEEVNGSRQKFESRNISINIDIDKNLNRNVWGWMMDNPGKTLTIVIIPLVAFLGRKFFGDDKKKKTENEPDEKD